MLLQFVCYLVDTSHTGSRRDNYDAMQSYGYSDKEYTYEEVVITQIFVNIYILESGFLRVLYWFYLYYCCYPMTWYLSKHLILTMWS